MDHIVFWSVFTAGLAATAAGFLTARNSAVFGILRQNLSRLRELKGLHAAETDVREKTALEAVIRQCEVLRKKWILDESDLHLFENTRRLTEAVAAAYHPNSPLPMAEARIGGLLEAFLDLKKRLLALTSVKGIRAVTHFRLRHIVFLSRAWKKKQEWEASRAARFVKKFKMHILADWAWSVYRCFDTGFWIVKMLRYALYDLAFRILLIGWYLAAGELAGAVYRDKTAETDAEAEKIVAGLDEFPYPEEPGKMDLPEGVRALATASRKDILFKSWELEWREAGTIYERLTWDIARFHHPHSECPLYEARLFRLLTNAARFADAIASLQNYPLVNKALNLRVRHILWAKDAADSLANNPLATWLKKHRLRQIVNVSSIVYKTIQKGTPAALFKDIAFSLVKEGAKRWICLFLHEKIALEANAIYKEE